MKRRFRVGDIVRRKWDPIASDQLGIVTSTHYSIWVKWNFKHTIPYSPEDLILVPPLVALAMQASE